MSRLDGLDLGSEARWLEFWLDDLDLGLAWSDHGLMARIAAQWFRGSDLEMVLPLIPCGKPKSNGNIKWRE